MTLIGIVLNRVMRSILMWFRGEIRCQSMEIRCRSIFLDKNDGPTPDYAHYFYGGLHQKLVGVEGAEPIRQII